MNVIEALEKVEAAPAGERPSRDAWRRSIAPTSEFLLANGPRSGDHVWESRSCPLLVWGCRSRPATTWMAGLIGLTRQLAERELSGNAAQQQVGEFLARCSDSQRKWTERVLKQDLSPEHRSQGGQQGPWGPRPFTSSKSRSPRTTRRSRTRTWRGRWAVSAKLDGGRAVAVLEKGRRCACLSRTGKEWGNFESIRSVLDDYNKRRMSTENSLPGWRSRPPT